MSGTLVSCNDYVETDSTTFLEGSSKTPIAVQTNLSAALQSRAVDKKFESGDVLLAYIEAGKTTDAAFSSDGNPFKGLKTLTLTAEADNTAGDNHKELYGYSVLPAGLHITETEDAGLQKLYWDDYSSTEKDLRDAGAGIRLKYGYCYNGGTPTTALDEDAGTLGWTIGDQTTAAAFKKTDLLFAKTQAPVSYTHGTAETSNHGVLVLPYSHAMSKVTVVVTAGEGFTNANNFGSTDLSLQHINTVCSVDAPKGEVTSENQKAVKTYKSETVSKTETESNKATFQAIVAPGTNLTVGNLMAKIANVDGNNYDIPVSVDVLDGWKERLTETTPIYFEGPASQAQAKPMSRAASIDQAKGYLTQSGVHYVLNVTINKQVITVRATLADWDKVEATANAQIVFNPDVVGKEPITNSLLQAKGFDVYKSSTNDAFSTKSTTLTYAAGKWTYSPVIYWQGQSDASFFRAVSPAGNSSSEVAQGTDLMWGTSGDVAVTPRTGDVPLDFKHIMSKLCVKLETSTDAAKVDLTGATVKITNLANAGTYDIVNGTVTAGDKAEVMIAGLVPGTSEFVIPQTIGDDAKLVITLADGTTYSLQLNQCVVTGTENPVEAWVSGKSYTYTIHLEKEKITFRALVENWKEATGNGTANLEWD